MERTAQEAKHDTDKLRNEVTHLMTELDDARGVHTALETAAQEQAEKARVAKREMEVVKQESEQMLKLMESMERKLRDVTEAQEAATNRAASMQEKADGLELAVDEATAQAHASKLAAERAEERRLAEVAQLKQLLDQEAERSLPALGAATKLREVEEQLLIARTEAQQARQDCDEARSQLANDVSRLTRQVTLLQTEKAQLDSNAQELQASRLDAEQRYDEATQESNRLQAELARQSEESSAKIGAAESAAQRARSDADAAAATLSRTEGDRQHLESQVAEARTRSKAELAHAEQKL